MWAPLVAQMVKRLPAKQETRIQSLGREDPQEKEMANHSSTLAWKIPWTEEPGRPQSMESQRVGHDWATSLLTSIGDGTWRRKRLPTPVFWPGEFHGLYSPWGRKDLDRTERLSLHFTSHREWERTQAQSSQHGTLKNKWTRTSLVV